jgi:hypothetical protein
VRLSSQPSEDDTSQFSPNEIHAILSLAPEGDDEAEVFQSPSPGKASAALHEEVTRDVTRSARQAAHTSARERFKEVDETTRRVSLQARKQEQARGDSGELVRGRRCPRTAPQPARGRGRACCEPHKRAQRAAPRR